MTAAPEMMTIPHIRLAGLPADCYLPEGARELLTTWENALAAHEMAEVVRVRAVEAEGAARAGRLYAADRAAAKGAADPGPGPEAKALAAARATSARLWRVATHAHDDAARCIDAGAETALAAVLADDPMPTVRRAVAVLVRAVEAMASRTPAISYYQRVISAPRNSVDTIDCGGQGRVKVDNVAMTIARLAEILASIEAVPER
jgi:hypothetical protein